MGKNIDYSNVQFQVFYDNACTEWMPNGQQLMQLSDQELAQLMRNQVKRSLSIGQTAVLVENGEDLDWPEFKAQLDTEYPINVRG